MTLGRTHFPIHPIPTTGTAGALNAGHLRCDCSGERTDPTQVEVAIKPFRWVARVLSVFLSEGLVSIYTDSSWGAERRKLLEFFPQLYT